LLPRRLKKVILMDLLRSGFKTSDQVSRLNAGLHI